MFTQKQIENLVDLLLTVNGDTKIYLGCDSVRFRKDGEWYAKFATVCVVHINGKNGCKVFSNRSVERDYDLKKNRPSMRLMTEVRKVCELYDQLAPFIDEFDVEIHIDINPNPIHGSNCVAASAAGYVLGVTGIQPILKPNALSASFCADHYAHYQIPEEV